MRNIGIEKTIFCDIHITLISLLFKNLKFVLLNRNLHLY